ncbi:hypothetical protein [Vibrio gallicus]|uniref:hypothetical protein n=1 Tax=Vibrio gallicus TaxID=190897 RepID=UPI0021C361E1|nr:hypothetical protein [Vibrio gallicus]
MRNYARVEVWFQVGTEQVLLGEVGHKGQANLLALWRGVREVLAGISASQQVVNPHYTLALFDDDGHMIGRKCVSEKDAEKLLENNHWMLCHSPNAFNRQQLRY